jgi:hypothetical protein
MSYSEIYATNFENASDALVADCKAKIVAKWNSMFDMWLSFDADHDLAHIYIDNFNVHFEKYMTSEVKTQLWFAAKNLVFALGAFIKYSNDLDLEEVLEFVSNFLEEQFDDFDNWCDDISTAMYEESPEFARDNAEK